MIRAASSGNPAARRAPVCLALVSCTLLTAACAPERPVSTAVRTVDFETDEGTNLAFDLSPDGQTIVIDLLGQLWLVPVSGGPARQLTDAVRDTAEDIGPSFSPDGRWIAFQSDRPGGLGLWRIPVEGGAPEPLHEQPHRTSWEKSNPAWSPTGREIAFAHADTVWAVDTESGAARVLMIAMPGEQPPGFLDIAAPTWSPDGSRLAFSTGSGGAFRAAAGWRSRIWEVPMEGGVAEPLTDEGLSCVAPAYAPEGDRLAYFASDPRDRYSERQWQLWVRSLPDGEPRRLTDQAEMAVRSIRWMPDGESLIYSAAGRLWRIRAAGGPPEEIPFTARVTFERRSAQLLPVHFPEPGSEQPARGFEGLALSPDGRRIAMLALDRLWVWAADDRSGPREPLAEVPEGASSPSWSPDGTEIVYSAGDLFVTAVATGTTRRLTALPGNEESPAWSPDGQYIAFVHGRRCGGFTCSPGAIRLMRPDQPFVRDTTGTRRIGNTPPNAPTEFMLAWSPDTKNVLGYDAYRTTALPVLAPIEGEQRTLDELPRAATCLAWPARDSVVYIRGNRLWKAAFNAATGELRDATPLSDDAAQEPSMAANGSILYGSGDGLRLRTPDGRVQRLGWPVTYRVPPAPPPLLIRGANLIDGTGSPATDPRDILVEEGRIVRISPAGSIEAPVGARILDASGKTVLPGFIDVHRHLFFPRVISARHLLGALYFGTTTIRDVGSTLARTAGVRDLVQSGELPGPRVVFAGSMFDGVATPRLMGLTNPSHQFITEPDQVARGLALARAFGAQFVKHYGEENWAEMVRTIAGAHGRGVRIAGHCTSVLPAAAAGADGQEHAAGCLRDLASPLQSDVAKLKAEAGMWTSVNPALRYVDMLRLDDPEHLSRPDIAAFTRTWSSSAEPRSFLENRYRSLRAGTTRLHEAGVLLASGTDLGRPDGTQINLQGMVDAGLTPMEAIAAATSNAARVIGAESEIGTVETGKLADLVILDADPLADIRNTERIWQVIQGGRIVDRQALLERARALGGGAAAGN